MCSQSSSQKNLADAQHVHGCLQYVQSAFEFGQDARLQVGIDMGIISDSMKSSPFKWEPLQV